MCPFAFATKAQGIKTLTLSCAVSPKLRVVVIAIGVRGVGTRSIVDCVIIACCAARPEAVSGERVWATTAEGLTMRAARGELKRASDRGEPGFERTCLNTQTTRRQDSRLCNRARIAQLA